MKSKLFLFCLALAIVSGCMKDNGDEAGNNGFKAEQGKGLYVVNQGNFSYGNASLSYYDRENKSVSNNLFFTVNDQKLGDVAQSMTLGGGRLWIVVNNSSAIFALDPETLVEKGRITDLVSPRYIHFISEEKAYVSQMWDSRICIVNPKTYKITGYIETEGTDGAEHLVQIGDYVYTNCWTNQKRILKIDIATDKIVGEVEVGVQPAFMTDDADGKLWVITDGGYEGCTAGNETPAISRIDPATMTVEKKMEFAAGSWPAGMAANSGKDTLYYINGGVYSFDIKDDALPENAFIPNEGQSFYAISLSPDDSEIVVADAIDYKQAGSVYRYSSKGTLLDKFSVGIIPGGFLWY